MSFEYGKEQAQGIPYEPHGKERELVAAMLLEELFKTIGSTKIVRFRKNYGRFSVPLPQGEELLRYAQIDLLGSTFGNLRLRILVDIPCSPPEEGILFRDPYVQTFELLIPKQYQESHPEHPPFAFHEEVGDGPPPFTHVQPDLPTQHRTKNALYMAYSALFLAAAFCVTTHCTNTKQAVNDVIDKPAHKKKEEPRDDRAAIPQMRPR